MIMFTEEMVLNPDALGDIPRGFRYYREEIHVDGLSYPIEQGYLWLPPHVDISKLEDLINGI